MRIHALNHLVEAARALGESRKVIVLGSASVLASFPEVGEQGLLDSTFDGDLLLDPISKEIASYLTESLGQGSLFRAQKGYHADILHPAIVESLPPGWEDRLVRLEGFDNVFALDPYDLAAVKLAVGREKDVALVRGLLGLGKISLEKLRARLNSMPLGEKEMFRAGRNLAALSKAE
ncbi:MAG: DUF6036 family nucleotidyltransferase [Verrucomicrobiota bacterium]